MASLVATPTDDRAAFWQSIEDFRYELQSKTSAELSTREVQARARAISQTYFREIRPALALLGIEPKLQDVDAAFQLLLKQGNSKIARAGYVKTVDVINDLRPQLEVAVELEISRQMTNAGLGVKPLSPNESAILETLSKMLPTAAASYKQACEDLKELKRTSFRGTAAEIRECLREVLDHLAPDEAISKSPGYRVEAGRTGPTMKQKARFILKARNVSEAARENPEGMVSIIEDSVSALPRSVYNQGSVATHSGQARQQVAQFKMYADAVLSEVLQINLAD